MDTLTWREVDLGGVVLAGVAGGYLMALVGLWAGRVPGLVAIDSGGPHHTVLSSSLDTEAVVDVVTMLRTELVVIDSGRQPGASPTN